MKLQEVLLRATAGKIKWWQAAELMGISERQIRRWAEASRRTNKGLLDRRRGILSCGVLLSQTRMPKSASGPITPRMISRPRCGDQPGLRPHPRLNHRASREAVSSGTSSSQPSAAS